MNNVSQVGRFKVRLATIEDVARIIEVDQTAFNGFPPMRPECFYSWLEIFPDGFKVALNNRDEIVAYSMALRKKKRQIQHNWELDTDKGMCTSHTPDGDVLYGVSLASLKPGAGTSLCLAERHLVEQTQSIKEIWLYGRLRGFAEWRKHNAPDLDLPESLDLYVRQHIDDVEVFYEMVGLTAIQGIEGYLPDDNESLGCAVWTIWQRPKAPRFRRPIDTRKSSGRRLRSVA